jgi:hypothetical protein
MRRVLLPLFFAFFLLPLAACDSSDDGGGGGSGTPGSIPGTIADARITWRAGGTNYSAQGDGQSNPTAGAAVSTYAANGVGGQGQLSLNATAIQGTTPSLLNMAFVGVNGADTYTLASGDGNIVTFTLTTVSGTTVTPTTYIADAGTLTVAELTEEGARGTFSFEAENPDDPSDAVSISNGRFAVLFTN